MSAASTITLPVDSTSLPESAEMYARLELPPIRLYGVTPTGCGCGNPECPPKNWGKHPVGKDWQKRATTDLDDVRDAFRAHRGNVGIYLGLTRLLLIDTDSDEGEATVQSWGLPPTLTQRSGSGGNHRHRIFRFASHQSPSDVTDRRVCPGVDVKARGQFVAAPSRHSSGGVYQWIDALPVATLPDAVYERVRKTQPAHPPPLTLATDSPDQLAKRADAYITRISSAISGSRGHDQTFAAARAIRGFINRGLPESDGWRLLLEYNSRCQPPWSEKELSHKWKQAEKAHTIPRIEDRPVPHRPNASAPIVQPSGSSSSGDDWMQHLMWRDSRSGKQSLINHIDNVVRILQLDPRWSGKIAFNEFAQDITVASDLPWDEYHAPSDARADWTDQDAARLSAWMRRAFQGYNFDPSVSDCERAVDIVARTHGYHPVRTYLDSVVWDGTPRIGQWTSAYLGAEDTEYHRTVGLWWLISAVARIYDPGCKVDTVTILEGKQGKRKSTAIKTLVGHEWFSDAELDVTSKDASMLIQGYWMLELAEVDSLMKREPSEAKRFFSRDSEHYRPPWAKRPIVVARQCVFIGTTNLDEYLFDPTGARRYLPLRCGIIDIDAIARDRDQLWAEAVTQYQEGVRWYPQTEAAVEMLAGQQGARTSDDAWAGDVMAFLTRTATDSVTTSELFTALDIPIRDRNRAGQMRLGGIMSALGWPRRRERRTEGLVWAYRRADGS